MSIAISVILIVSIPSVIFNYLFTFNVSERALIRNLNNSPPLAHHHRTDRKNLKCSLVKKKKKNTKISTKITGRRKRMKFIEY